MARVTPALDRLTETARADYLRNITHPEMVGTGLPQGMTMGEMLASKTIASAGANSYLQLSSLVTMAVPRLYNLRRGQAPFESDEKILEQAIGDPALHGVGKEITANVGALVWDVDDYLTGLLSQTVTQLPDPQVSALLLELWHIREEEFDPDAPGSEVDLNADDAMSATFDHPQHYLLDLIVDTIIARLMKRHGPELLLAWADAVGKASR
ncbi:hypothetical protein CcI156_18140 [Frankia sp. CcI156]|uniref:hypothetical protein n=1 Tax=unclassified Frankia TaxID=2632575 RepID=UPI000554C842|nr:MULTISPECIES: hypothetical protein [unclassified Frankia]ONH23579.1 hypothetical protein CcI156_18140 [Frankia sp. CcI156]